MPILALAGCRHWEGTPRWLSDALFTSLYASLVPAGEQAKSDHFLSWADWESSPDGNHQGCKGSVGSVKARATLSQRLHLCWLHAVYS